MNEFFSAALLLLVSERSRNDTPCRYHPRYHGRANTALALPTGGNAHETDAHAEVEPPGQRAVPSGSRREPEQRPVAPRISHATAGRRNSPAAPIAKITIHAKAAQR